MLLDLVEYDVNQQKKCLFFDMLLSRNVEPALL